MRSTAPLAGHADASRLQRLDMTAQVAHARSGDLGDLVRGCVAAGYLWQAVLEDEFDHGYPGFELGHLVFELGHPVFELGYPVAELDNRVSNAVDCGLRSNLPGHHDAEK